MICKALTYVVVAFVCIFLPKKHVAIFPPTKLENSFENGRLRESQTNYSYCIIIEEKLLLTYSLNLHCVSQADLCTLQNPVYIHSYSSQLAHPM